MAKYKRVEDTKETFGKRVANFKNVTTEENVDMFGAKVISEWKKQIRIRTTKLSSMEEDYNNAMIDHNQKLEEYRQAYENSFLDIDETRVDSVDKRSSYVSTYETQINKALQNYEAYKVSVFGFGEDYKKEVAKQEEKIRFYNDCLARIS